jgi:hypothetical protein
MSYILVLDTSGEQPTMVFCEDLPAVKRALETDVYFYGGEPIDAEHREQIDGIYDTLIDAGIWRGEGETIGLYARTSGVVVDAQTQQEKP